MKLMLTEKSKAFCDALIKRQNKDLDAVIGVTGFEGSGKSSLSIQFAKYIAKHNGTKFTLDKNIIYGDDYEKVIRTLKTMPPKSVIILDEAISLLYKRNSNTKNQKKINILFSIIRQKNYIIFLNIPNITDIDSFYLNHRILAMIQIFARGYYYVLGASPNPYAEDKFNIKIASQLYDENMFTDKSHLISILKRNLPNFLFWSRVYNLDPEYYAKYNELKEKYTIKNESDEVEKENKKDVMLVKAITELYKSNPKMTYGRIATILGTTKYKVKKIITEGKIK